MARVPPWSRLERFHEASWMGSGHAYASFLEVFSPLDKQRLYGPRLKGLLAFHDSRSYLADYL